MCTTSLHVITERERESFRALSKAASLACISDKRHSHEGVTRESRENNFHRSSGTSLFSRIDPFDLARIQEDFIFETTRYERDASQLLFLLLLLPLLVPSRVYRIEIGLLKFADHFRSNRLFGRGRVEDRRRTVSNFIQLSTVDAASTTTLSLTCTSQPFQWIDSIFEKRILSILWYEEKQPFSIPFFFLLLLLAFLSTYLPIYILQLADACAPSGYFIGKRKG